MRNACECDDQVSFFLSPVVLVYCIVLADGVQVATEVGVDLGGAVHGNWNTDVSQFPALDIKMPFL